MDSGAQRRGRRRISREDYRALAAFRHALRRFAMFSEAAAHAQGLTAQQHQAILAIKGHMVGERSTIGDLAEQLLIKHHSAVELVDRLCRAGLVTRLHAEADRRNVLIALTPKAETLLEELSSIHIEELRRSRASLVRLLDRVDMF